MINSQKKGQASLEYLSTYAWAFMVLLLFAGILVYFNFFNVERFAGQYCSFGSNFYCKDYSIHGNSSNYNMTILLENNMNKDVEINQTFIKDEDEQAVVCSEFNLYCDEYLYMQATPSNTPPQVITDADWTPTSTCVLEYINCNKAVIKKEKERARITLNFSAKGHNTSHITYGTVFANVN